MAAGTDPYVLMDRAVAAAAAMSGGAQPRSEKQIPASMDGFGWCTWDAFYSRWVRWGWGGGGLWVR